MLAQALPFWAARADIVHGSAIFTEEVRTMRPPQTGGCHCGYLRYEITQAPRLVYSCHCTDCQKMTSSAFSMGLVVAEEAFRLTAGEPRLVQRAADSGRMTTRLTCPNCGSWITGTPRMGGALRTVRAGT